MPAFAARAAASSVRPCDQRADALVIGKRAKALSLERKVVEREGWPAGRSGPAFRVPGRAGAPTGACDPSGPWIVHIMVLDRLPRRMADRESGKDTTRYRHDKPQFVPQEALEFPPGS
jgi:hypothetical protein